MIASLWARLGGGGRPGRPHDEAKASEVKDGATDGEARDAGGGSGGVEVALDSVGREKAMAASQVGGIIVQATYQESLQNRSLKLPFHCTSVSRSRSLVKSLCFRPKTTTRT